MLRKASGETPTCRRPASTRREMSDKRSSIEYQPYVKVQKIDSLRKFNKRRLRSSSSPMNSRTIQPKAKRLKLSPRSRSPKQVSSPPVSPRKLRRPRGRWYRDR